MAKLALAFVLLLTFLVDELNGQAVQVVNIGEQTRKFELNVSELEKVLLSAQCKDKPVSIVSIAGATRQGKSFMLNFFLKYLMAAGSSDWLGSPSAPLTGFSWRGGSKRDTTGILLWSKPFVIRSNGKDVCVLLMDTQGSFDGKQTVADTAAIFAISTMTSSVQLYNLFHSIQEDYLQHLELFTEYGRLAVEQNKQTPFQKLMFLVRDFRFPDDFAYGLTGGQKFLDDKLKTSTGQAEELRRVRENIRRVFEKLECFLMPYPGDKVARTVKYDGRLSDISQPFVDQLKVLVPLLFAPSNIVVKKINGLEVTGAQLLEYFKAYVKVFTSGKLAEPKSILEATALVDNQNALNVARDYYRTQMELSYGQSAVGVAPSVFDSKQTEIFNKAIDLFDQRPKIGSKAFSKSYVDQLKVQLFDLSVQYRTRNQMKYREIEEKQNRCQVLKSQIDNQSSAYGRILRDSSSRNSALEIARGHYVTLMQRIFNGTKGEVQPSYLQTLHIQYARQSVDLFKKNGGDMLSTSMDILRQELQIVNQHNQLQNNYRKLCAT